MSAPRSSRSVIDDRDHLIGLGMAAVFVVWLLLGARSLGFARDEGFYFRAAGSYMGWFDMLQQKGRLAFERSSIDAYWAANHEHPSLVKSLFALSSMLFHKRLHLFADESTAFRLPGMLFAGLAMYVTYLFGARAYSRRAGVAAAWLLVLAPNVFYNCHLACFDIPIMAMWILCIYVYWRASVERTWGWVLACGIVYGFTLDTKHNSWILPLVFIVHTVCMQRRGNTSLRSTGGIVIPAPLVSMALIGPAVFVTLWPWLWNDTIPRFQEYVSFHVNHEYYNIEFLRKNYWGPPSPRLYAPVMIAATVPTITVILFLVGFFDRVRVNLAWLADRFGTTLGARLGPIADSDVTSSELASTMPDLLIALGFFAALGPWILERTPIFGGTKHWMTAYPSLALFAGYAFDRACTALTTQLARVRPQLSAARARDITSVALGVAVFTAPVLVTAHSHPFGLSAYVPFFGGTAGGASLGLNRQFWGFTTESVAPYFAKLPPRTTVYFHDTAWDSWTFLQAEKRVRPDLVGVGTAPEATVSLTHHELHMAAQDVINWLSAGTPAPDEVVAYDGVPIVSVYRRNQP